MIHTHLERGLKPAAIATGLNRPASTLARELKRNGWIRPKTRGGPGRPPMAGGYRAEGAHTRARVRRAWFAAYDRDLHCGLRSSTL